MTREEAIWYLQPIADSASLPRYAEALNMAIAALREQLRWIRVQDALPEELVPVLVYRRSKARGAVVEAGYYCGGGKWKTLGQPTRSVSHWMKLPEGPKEGL